jgi:hypothetical protein
MGYCKDYINGFILYADTESKEKCEKRIVNSKPPFEKRWIQLN